MGLRRLGTSRRRWSSIFPTVPNCIASRSPRFPRVNNPLAGCTILINGTDIGPALFDAVTGELLPLMLPAGYDDSPLFPFNGWQRTYKEQRFALLSDGTPNHVLLADVQSGHTIDLETLVYLLRGDESRLLLILGAALSQDESTLLLMTDRDTWLVPTANPAGARPLTGAARGTAVLSEDGMNVVYGTESEERASDVVVENLDGSDRTVVADGGMRPFSYWLPGSGGRQILVVHTIEETVSLLDLVAGTEQSITGIAPGAPFGRPIFAPSGRRVLLGTIGETRNWTWVDLDQGQAQVVAEPEDFPIPYTLIAPGLRWLTFFPTDRPMLEPGSSIRAIDLETGAVNTPLTFDFEEQYPGVLPYSSIPSSPDGRFTIVNDLGRDFPRFWLIDAQAGSSTTYEGRIATAFSPDGQQLLVAERANATDNRVWRTLIMTIDGQEVRILAESLGRGGFWVPSPYTRSNNPG